jgi:hypothetical protein
MGPVSGKADLYAHLTLTYFVTGQRRISGLKNEQG